MNRMVVRWRSVAPVLSLFVLASIAGCGGSLGGGSGSQATQTINFTAVGAQTVGATVTLSATASSGLPVTFASQTTTVCTVSGTTATMISTGTCTLEAQQAGSSKYLPVNAAQEVTVSGKTQTITFATPGTQTAGTPLALTATASSGLSVSFASQTTTVCTVSGTTATFLKAGTCTIQAAQAGNATFAAATPVSVSFTVNPGALQSQTITFNNPGTQTVGTPLTLMATASSGLTVSFASQTTSVCTVSGTTATFLTAGTCTIQSTQAGNATFAAATPVSQSFTVNPGALQSQTITFNNPGAQTVSTPLALTATATSGLPVSFVSQTTSICTVSGTTATFLTTGTCTIQATQAGNTTFAAAAPVSVSFTVKPATTGGPLKITTTTCPGGTQGQAYAGCTLVASGGTPPYTFSYDTSGNFPPPPEGVSLDDNSGDLTGSQIGGEGTYSPDFIVTDSTSATATQQISFAINGSNAYAANIFPADSIFHHRMDAATTGLPVDTSPAAPMYSGYLSGHIRVFFGNNSNPPFPNGIPMFEVPSNQPDVGVSFNPNVTVHYQSYFTSGPIPANAPIEGTAAAGLNNDMHVLIYQEAGGGNPPALYEMWQGVYNNGPWFDTSNALWPNVSTDALTPQGNGTSDAAGLPVAPLVVNADEVIGTGTPTTPNGTVQHPIRFTLNHMLNYWVWPGTETAGVGSCTDSTGSTISTGQLISQSMPPSSCTMTGPAGEIYRLKASTPTPSCATNSPQAAIIITAFRNYGIILADNGISGGLIGTPDARWDDNDLSCLTNIQLSDFEPVNVSSLMVNNDSGQTVSSGTTSQTITFTNPGAQTVGTPLTLSATASSGLAVSFASQTTSICKVSGATATFLIAGTCIIQATQPGSTTYAAAPPISQSFVVSSGTPLSQTITFNNPGAQTVGTPLTLTATSDSGLTVALASQTTSVCTVNGTMTTFLIAGTCTIQATQPGNATYAAATPVSQSFAVSAGSAQTQPNYFGINIGTDLDWDTNRMFADAMKSSRAWGTASDAGTVLPNSALDANGWPLQDASLYVWAGIGSMQGTYALSFNGEATVQPSSGTISNQSYNSAMNQTTATLNYSSTDPQSYLTLAFTNTKRTATSGTNTGITNVVLMRPSAVGSTMPLSTTQVFNPPLLAALNDFAVLRTMDYSATNGNEIANWSDRTRPVDASQAIGNPAAPAGGWEGPGGSWEYAILLANTANKDLWINVPLNGTTDYVTKLAQLMRYGSDGTTPYTSTQTSPVWPGLNPGLHLYVEFANEVWNTAGAFQGNENHDEAVAEVNAGNSPLNFDGDTNDWYWAWRRPAEKTVEISKIFRQVWGDSAMMITIRPVLESQLGYPDGPLLQEMHLMVDYYYNPNEVSSPHPPNYYIYGLGGSGYYGPTDKSSVNQIFATMATGFSSAVEGDVDYSLPFGVRRIAYEGGPSLDSTGNSSEDANQAAAWADSRMEQVIVNEQNAWSQANGDLLVYYELTGDYQWSFMSDVLSPSSPKMSGTADILASSRSTSTYGTPIPATLTASNANVPPAWLWTDQSNTSMHDYKWTSFSVLVASQTAFAISLNANSATSNAEAEVFVDGNSLGTVTIPSSGYSATVTTPTLAIGSHGILIRSISGTFNLQYVKVQ